MRVYVWFAVIAALSLFVIPTGNLSAEQYKILVNAARVAQQRSGPDNSKPAWDISEGAPDPYVVVLVAGKPILMAPVIPDSFTPRWFAGTSWWKLDTSASVEIRVRDRDLGAILGTIGVGAIVLRRDLPAAAARMLNDELIKVDTDDTIGIWKGNLGQLVDCCGGANRQGSDVLERPDGRRFLAVDAGLEVLQVQVMSRPDDFDIESPPAGSSSYLSVVSASVEQVKRSKRDKWDLGMGAARNPDPYCVVWVNGEPVLGGATNEDSHEAVWGGDVPALHLFPDDTIAISLLDADAGTALAGVARQAVLFSSRLSADAKNRLFQDLAKANTDDPILLWIGTWKQLRDRGEQFDVPLDSPSVWLNEGLERLTIRTVRPTAAVNTRPLKLVVKSGRVGRNKADGKSWDARNGKPDPMVRVFVAASNGGWQQIGETAAEKDTLTPSWNLAVADERIIAGAQLKVEVYDKDLGSSDLIATITLTVPSSSGVVHAHGDQLEDLEIEFAAR